MVCSINPHNVPFGTSYYYRIGKQHTIRDWINIKDHLSSFFIKLTLWSLNFLLPLVHSPS